jgi:glutamate-1-semialdehyde aminotransferase
MKVVAIIQARMGSTRLPGKVMKDLGGKPVLRWCLDALNWTAGVDETWIATSTLPADDVIAEYCAKYFIPCHRGSETDVLSRFIGCAEESNADVVLRITGDCPFIDPQVIGGVVRLHKETGAPFVTNVSPRTYPDGLDVQLITAEALIAADREATRPIDRDCVTTWIERNRSRFPAKTLINPIPGMEKERWVLDTERDLEFCEAIAKHWSKDWEPPTMLDILSILDRHPEIRDLNAGHVMNERYFVALAEEPIYARTYRRSQEALARAEEVIPLGAQTFSKSKLQYPQPSPLFLRHGDGCLVWDVDGNEYVDLVSALLPVVLGYRDPDVDRAIRWQLDSGISFSLATELEAELAETLCRLIPCAEAVRFGKSGTDATTGSVRLARAFTGRDKVLKYRNGYHGWADWTVDRNLGVPETVRALTDHVALGDLPCPKLEEYAAVIIEPEGNPDHLRWVREACNHSGAILIFDEVITGFRFALGGAQELYGVTPDLACFGQAMANGMPLSAIVGRRDIMKLMTPPDNIFYSGTFFGEALSLAASLATITKLERDDIIPKIWATGLNLSDRVETMIANHSLDDVISLSGEAPFRRIKFSDDKIAALFRKEMVNSGTLIAASHNISASHGPNEIKRIRRSYDHALGVLREAIDKDDIKERLAGASVGPMVRA